MMGETKYAVGFSVFPGIGPVRFKLLREYFGSAKKAWNAPMSEFKKIRLGEKLAGEFDHFRNTFDLDDYLGQLEKLHVAVLTLSDPKYPKLLKQLSDAPFLIYVRGKRGKEPLNLDRTIAVVGTRKVTTYGTQVTQKITAELVSCGFTIVSGLAYGVDAIAHQTALGSGGQTIAVLGCGIDIIAPPSNARLYRDICEGGRGAIVSEMPLGMRPNKGLFPARNRIISGLSLGVVVTEGAEDSGALITARNAAEQGREVFAVPGPITSPYSKGPAKLFKQGAKLVESAQDIIEELKLDVRRGRGRLAGDPTTRLPARQVGRAETKEEEKILHILEDRQAHIDEIVRATNLTMSAVAATLSVLEIRGIVKDIGEKVYGLVL
ncbi:DNA-protecting protein DprA [Candidatus Gottesmanbacteria bacterium]|nr:DNA-protecting protein DprA [Candidatus Gottesmanbacteria bacterium]